MSEPTPQATDAATSDLVAVRPGKTCLRYLRHLRRLRLAIIGAAVILALIVCAATSPYLAPYDPQAMSLEQELSPPSAGHLLGQDKFGRDILSRIIYGARISLLVGVTTVLVSLSIGACVGCAAGFFGGLADEVFLRIVDIFLAFPGILLALSLMALLGPALSNVIIALCLVGWVGYARLARAQVLSLKERDFVLAARASGATDARIIFRHVLPNVLAPLTVEATFGMGAAITAEAALSFLGLGVQPPTPSWGSMLNEGRQFLLIAPHLTTFPGLAIMLVVLGFNFLGDGLRDWLDPRKIP
jgi:peptide/nickel transport system permease protein